MATPCLTIKNLTLAYADYVIQQDLNFTVNQGDIFIIMGSSGCGKSTLLMNLIGLMQPVKGDVLYGEDSLWQADHQTRQRLLQRTGVLFQSGALLSSMTLFENVALPLTEHTRLAAGRIRQLVNYKLALVGLAGFADFYPAELSGGMQKRAGLARAMALDPEILFFDEPSAGLDPLSAKLLDDLIRNLRDHLGTTIIMVTHELASIFAIGTNSVFLDTETKTMIAIGPPQQLLAESKDPKIIRFLTRGETAARPTDSPKTPAV
ncbi:ABC transporter ATP-binding protein [Methylovulum psychrotolerans]|uniref:Polyamine ABC transporter ATP-binding protein n=1 Tax=Methylovulum psychrotolerans TaxID=1704499 RepID=A0A2S5CKW9_9GAMM|nr:ATP-binding cassette domain-containing protein [Methylovulum psychrotolerans]POZ51424.1 polyamine ABC transporter ATP-binding protein [Methylovulum psychrotolerans]